MNKTALFLEQLSMNAPLIGGLFHGLSQEELSDLVGLSEMAVFDGGAEVFREGASGEVMYVVVSGKFAVSRTDALGNEVRLAVVSDGEIFGEIALLEHVRRTATVRALVPSVTLCFDRRALERWPGLTMKLYQNMALMLARRLRLTTDELLFQVSQAGLAEAGAGQAADR
ncbi:MAG: cyclic nucleotide-binding domain-containing protein [Hydrogenophilaceae bacterium]|nr:cyclic nucleotide-binding domain-containing protein [Hydrogenophilaceae bacterium]